MQVDDSELRAFAAILANAGAATEKDVTAVVHRGANNIVRDMKRQASSSKHFKGFASAISYDMRGGTAFGGGVIEAEIGPRKGAPGSLANIAYFGTSRGGGTVEDPEITAEREVPNFERALIAVSLRALTR